MSKDKYKILIIAGVMTSEHDPKVNGMLRMMLESTGRFKVKITEEFSGATPETLSSYDAVLINYDGREDVHSKYIGWGEQAERTLYDFVAAGKGVIVYHSSMIKGDPALPEEFVKLVGCDFNFGNGGRKSPKIEFKVNMNTDAHEITKGLIKSWTTPTDDLFFNAKWLPDSNVKVLATVYDDINDYNLDTMQVHMRGSFRGVDFSKQPGINTEQPVAWTNTYGKGRVFVVSIGHGPDTIRRHAFVSMMCRAAEWAASGEVTILPPDISGENRLRVWPYYLDMTISEYASLTQF